MIISNCKVIENFEIAKNIWRLIFESVEIGDDYKGAGQFITVLPNESWEHPIRRPMSISDVKDAEISIIYKIFGDVTKSLSKLRVDDSVDVSGPFGNTFNVDYEQNHPILIGGGIGLSPILNLSNCLRQKGVTVSTIIGAKTADEHFLEHNLDDKIYLSTDDGSIGIKGTVIDALGIVLKEVKNPKVYACGPEKMLSNLQTYLIKNNIQGQFSVESYMACGVGFCQGCVIPAFDEKEYHLVCKDGPVFDINEVSFG